MAFGRGRFEAVVWRLIMTIMLAKKYTLYALARITRQSGQCFKFQHLLAQVDILMPIVRHDSAFLDHED